MFEVIKRNLYSRPQRQLFFVWYILMGILVSAISFLTYIKQLRRTKILKLLLSNSTELISNEKIKMKLFKTFGFITFILSLIFIVTTIVSKYIKNCQFSLEMIYLINMIPMIYLCFTRMFISFPCPNNIILRIIYLIFIISLSITCLIPIFVVTKYYIKRNSIVITLIAFLICLIVTYKSNHQSILIFSRIVSAGLGAFCAIDLSNILIKSYLLQNICLILGLINLNGMNLYDIKETEIKIKKSNEYDFFIDSTALSFNFVNIYIRIAIFLTKINNKGNIILEFLGQK